MNVETRLKPVLVDTFIRASEKAAVHARRLGHRVYSDDFLKKFCCRDCGTTWKYKGAET